jgi:heme/copper-type cytochrome/quinol oxidase subunit 2
MGTVGKNVMIAGVALQVVVTACFVFLFVDYVCKRNKSDKSPMSRSTLLVVLAIAIATCAILIRCIFRLAEMVSAAQRL